MKHIFINYRMRDTTFEAAYLKIRIENRFENVEVFKDTRSTRAGDNLGEQIFPALDRADLVLSLIDPNWLNHPHPDTNKKLLNRLHYEEDWVRREIEYLHDQGKLDLLIPVNFREAYIPSTEECSIHLPPKLQCFQFCQ